MDEVTLAQRLLKLEARLEALAARERVIASSGGLLSTGVVYVATDGTLDTEAAFAYIEGSDEVRVGRARLAEQATPSTPASGFSLLFAGSSGDNNGVASSVDDAGTVYQMVRYATGTWTPTYGGLTTGGSTTYTTQQGNYTRLGDVIIAQFEITWTAASGTGIAFILLPFTARATLEFAMPIYPSNITYAGGPPYALVNTGTNYLVMGTPTSNAPTATLAVEAAGTVFGTAIYLI